MKRTLLFCAVLLLLCSSAQAAMTYEGDYYRQRISRALTGSANDPIKLALDEIEGYVEGTTGFPMLYLTPGTQPTSTEGTVYYDSAGNLLKLYNGSSWVNIDTAGGSSLDASYDVGNSITVDGDALTLTVGSADNNSALVINHDEATNNNDAMSITSDGSGDALQITVGEADGVAIRAIGSASQTTSMVVLDAATSNWDGADNIGMLHFTADDPFIHAGASIIGVHNSGQPITAAEGFLARFVSTGTARTNAYAVEIEVPATQPALLSNGIVAITGQDAAGAALLQVANTAASGNADAVTITSTGSGDCLQATVGEADGVAIRAIAAASQTTSLIVADAATSNWDGANDIGMVHLNTDDPYIHAGASALMITDSSTPISAAEGFLARFVHSGTARTNSSAVEIEVPATQPALAANGIVAVTGQDNPGAALVQITGIDTTGNSNTMSIDSSGSGNALYLDLNEADSQGLTVEPFTNSTVAALEVDGDAHGWDGADNVGMVHLRNDDPGIHAGATLLLVDDSSQPITAAEGFLARFVATGAARTNAYAVEIEVPATQPALAANGIVAITGQDAAGAALVQITNVAASGDADAMTITSTGAGDGLQITVGEADGVAQRNIAAASQTTSLAVFEGSTSNWDGADNVGMVHITTDDPVVHTGASLLNVTQSGQAIAAAEGFLARFIASGAARTDATAVEIEVAATQPALAVNGITKINGQDAAGATLFQVAGVGASGDADAMLISNTGAGHCLQITPGETDSGGINITGLASSTVSQIVVDGATNNWSGADNVGMVHIKSDAAAAHAGASLLQVVNSTGQPIAAAEGFLARFVDTGTARTDAYAVEIEVTATTGGLYSSGHATFEKGCQVLSQSVTATTDGLSTGLIPDHASFVTVTTDSADKVVVLPTWVIGHEICIVVPSTGCEVETLAASNDTINTVDCDGANQLALTAAGVYTFKCVADSTWIAYGWAANGAAVATLTPDAD